MLRLAVTGETEMLVRTLAFTVTESEPDAPEIAAEMLAWPAVTLVNNPLAETVAIAILEEDHAAVEVTSPVEPSL
jgi:hypothetical protein